MRPCLSRPRPPRPPSAAATLPWPSSFRRASARGPIAFGPVRHAEPPKSTILADSADPIAPQVLGGLIQKVVMTSMPAVDGARRHGRGRQAGAAGSRRSRRRGWRRRCARSARRPAPGPAGAGPEASGGLVARRDPRPRRRDEEEPDRRVLRRRASASCSCSSRPPARAARSSRKPRAALSIASSRRGLR